MKSFRWSPEKNQTVKAERGILFESIVVAIEAGGLLDILAHPNQAKYPRQRVLVVACDNCACLVPFVARFGADAQPCGAGTLPEWPMDHAPAQAIAP